LPEFKERLGTGAMEYWSAGKKTSILYPLLPYCNIPKLIMHQSSYGGLLSFGL